MDLLLLLVHPAQTFQTCVNCNPGPQTQGRLRFDQNPINEHDFDQNEQLSDHSLEVRTVPTSRRTF